jgi:Xaa-Pro aminopeptidase
VDHRMRRDALAARLPELAVDAFLVTGLSNVRYLSGFTGSNAQALITPGDCVFMTDGRYTEQARHEVPDMRRVTYLGAFVDALPDQIASVEATRVGFESHHVTVHGHRELATRLTSAPAPGSGGVELLPLDGEVEHLRWVKDDEELEHLRRAQAITDQAFDDLLDLLAIGMTERTLAHQLEELLRREGADGLSFDSIVAFGEHAAEPHHEPGHRALEEGDVIVLDFGALYGGYHADMTRTIAFGEPPTELKKVHDIVRQAQQAGIDAVAPGATGAEVDRAARSVISDAGYGDRFGHGLGHGVGLDIHEGPRLGRDYEDHMLPVGAVVTVEPGVYIPGLGGVRIEDVVEVVEGGGRVMGSANRDLIEL